MSFTVGLLEVIGYLVPGGATLACALWLLPSAALRFEAASAGAGRTVVFLLAAYVTGHVLTALSRSLTWARVKIRGHGARRWTFWPTLRARLHAAYGADLGAAEEYHLSRQLVAERSTTLSDRIDRLFAVTLFCRNAAVALLVCAVFAGVARDLLALAVFALLAALFAFQHARFERTQEATVFRAAFVLLAGPAHQPPNGRD